MAKPVCFMVMPFGTKPTGADPGKGPPKVNFDALWDNAFEPMISELGYEPIRADKDLGALIIKDMIERLALADVVVADVSLPNANVYYELGVRHAAKEKGCVTVAADWSHQVFDIDQMRQLRYPLPVGEITPDTAKSVRSALMESVEKMTDSTSPVFDSVAGYPDNIDISHANSFKDFVDQLSEFQAKARGVRNAPREQQADKVLALRDVYLNEPVVASVALELMGLLRDYTDWKTTLAYINGLPKNYQQLPEVQEQRCLAISKGGDPAEAVGLLEQLIENDGDSTERRGLLGGRYKKLFNNAKHPADKARYLEHAIDHYERGMQLDLNDYYPTSNLARLYRTRGKKGDDDKAKISAIVTVAACQRAKELGLGDEWLPPTLLGAAFDAEDITVAESLYEDIVVEGHAMWKLQSTITDLERSVDLVSNPEKQEQLNGVLQKLKALV